MQIKSILAAAAIALAASVGSAFAADQFATLADVAVVKLTSDQLAGVRGAAHVRLLVEFKAGDTPPTGAAVAATTSAGSIGAIGNDRPAILALLP